MGDIQQKIIERLNEIPAFVDEDEGYQCYMRRELFEKFLYSEDGLEFCGCGNQEESLQAVADALTFAATVPAKDRALVLTNSFGVEKVSDSALVQVLFYLLTARGFIDHEEEDSIDDSKLTAAGQVFLLMLKHYLGQ